MQHSDKPSMGNVKHSPKDKFVLNDVSKEELEKEEYRYILIFYNAGKRLSVSIYNEFKDEANQDGLLQVKLYRFKSTKSKSLTLLESKIYVQYIRCKVLS